VTLDGFLNSHLLVEASQGILPLKLLELGGRVLVEEFVEGEESTTNTNVDLIFVNLNGDTFGAELVDALALAHEHNLELLAIGVVVNVLGQLLVDGVALDGDVHSDARLEVNDVLLQSLGLVVLLVDFELSILELLQQVQRCALRFVEFGLQLDDVLGGGLEFLLQFDLSGINLSIVLFDHGKLLLDVFLDS